MFKISLNKSTSTEFRDSNISINTYLNLTY